MDSGYVHKMNLLDADQSWELLLRKTFVGETHRTCPEELKNIAKEILQKCGGLPLAISVVGGLLAVNPKCEREWMRVDKEMKFHLDRIVGGDIDTVSAFLELSYQNLPPEIKACFLCFRSFKEDASISGEKLVHIWVALSLVAPSEEITLEDAAKEYLHEFVRRNMVQVVMMEHDRVIFCRMHDLFRDISMKKAKEEIYLEVVSEEKSSHQSLDKPRHRAIHFCRPSYIYSTGRNQHFRSLFIHGNVNSFEDGSPSSYWKSFEMLKVLNFQELIFNVLPKAIGVLFGLRYLSMSYEGERSRPPRSWAKLKNLKVLELVCHDMLIIIDKVILEMDSLCHVYIDISDSKVPFRKMRNLQTLDMFRVNDVNLWQIQGMVGISSLIIDARGVFNDQDSLYTCLATFENLNRLTLFCGGPVNMAGLSVSQLTRNRFSDVMSMPGDFPPNLSHLTLHSTMLTKDPMPVLEKLPNLLSLKLSDCTSFDETMVTSCDGFPSLKVLHLEKDGTDLTSLLQTLLMRAGHSPPKYKTKHLKTNEFCALVEFNGMRFVGKLKKNKAMEEKDAAIEALAWLTQTSENNHTEDDSPPDVSDNMLKLLGRRRRSKRNPR